MSSLYRKQLEQWVSEIEVTSGKVLDVGGGQLPIGKRVRTWQPEEYKLLDVVAEYKPDIFHDMNYPINQDSSWKDLTDPEMAYIAGIVDGEGCFSITDGGGRKFSVSFGINMADSSALRMISKVFRCPIRNFIASDNKPYFNIQLSGDNLKEFILAVYPYLRVKRKEAELALEMRASLDSTKGKQKPRSEGGGSEPLGQEIIEYRNKIVEVSKAIKAGKYRNFDTVFCLEVAEYIWSPFIFHQNLNDFLKPGGVAYISYPTLYPLHNPPGTDYLRYTKFAIEKLLAETGFTYWEITPRVATAGAESLVNFWSKEAMRPSKGAPELLDIGYMVKAIKKEDQ